MRKIFVAVLLLIATQELFAQNCNTDFSVQFLNASTIKFTPAITTDSPLVQHTWRFGDGVSVTGPISPTHGYTAGTYTVLHILIRHNNAGVTTCMDSTTRVVTIANACNLVAGFNFHAAANNPREISFTNTSTGAVATDSIRWTFGDGTSGTGLNPVHVYAAAGVYHVCLRIQKREANGTLTNCVGEFCATVTIQATCNFTASYTRRADSVNRRKIYFTNTTAIANTNQANWSFGDGTTASTWNATHEYAQPGRYYVCLTVTDGNCVRTSCDSLTVESTPPTGINCANIVANFYDHRDSAPPNRISFTAVANATIIDQVWTIKQLPGGATITLHTNNPSYVFTDTGTYRVCLHAKFANDCVKEVCKNFHITTPMPGNNVCHMQLYPNPAHNTINASLNLTGPGIIHAYIYNNMGLIVAQLNQPGIIGNNIVTLNVATLPTGMYTFKILHEGQICSGTFYKRQ